EQVVAGPMAAVVVRRRIFDGEVDEPGFLIDRNLRPDASVAVDRPRFVLPRVVAELAGTWNGVERPEQLAGPDVERAHETLGVVGRRAGHAFLERGAVGPCVADDRWRRVQADLAGLEFDLLPLAGDRALLQIDDAALAERRHHRAVLGVERDQAIAGGHVEHTVVAFAVGPVRHAPARQLPRGDRGAVALAIAVRPDHLAA